MNTRVKNGNGVSVVLQGFLLCVSLLGFLTVLAGNSVNPDAIELVPLPKPIEFESNIDSPVAFDSTTSVLVDCPDGDGVKWLSSHFADWFGQSAPKVKSGKCALELKEGSEAYAVETGAEGVKIAARTLAGVRWAAYSLRQLAIAKRGAAKIGGRILPTLKMSDRPHLGFRAVHLCWFPELRPQQIERAIRLAALMKFNYAIIEPWGMYESEKHPWWHWPNPTMTKSEVRRLVAVGKDLGITLIPQINVYGHGSAARSISMKHVALDFHPECEPFFEPGGWNWCITNPETQRVLRELIAEMHEDFGNPPFFHLGCDEAQPPSCPECRKIPYGELVCRHISGLASYVKSRGAQAMMWHDMLLDREDERWKKYVRSGSKTTASMVDRLPKDMVICDWQYDNRDAEHTRWPTVAYFNDKGFPVAISPWENFKSMRAMADFVGKIGGFGYIQTTWHRLNGKNWVHLYRYGSSAAWGSSMREQGGSGWQGPTPRYDTEFALLLRFVGHDMKVSSYSDTGLVNRQIQPEWWTN